MHRYRYPVLVLALLALALTALSLGAAGVPEDPPDVGDWLINGQKEFEGKSGYVEGSVILLPHSRLEIIDSTLVVNVSMGVNDGASLFIKNSTIYFNCSMDQVNALDVLEMGSCTIVDGDEDASTMNDASLITSTNDLAFNISARANATFVMRNSVISKCGRPFSDPFLTEGVFIGSKDAQVIGSVIRDGYYGIILEDAERAKIENTTIEDCHVGMYMVGTRDCLVTQTTIRNCTASGLEYRGFHGRDILDSLKLYGNGFADMNILYVSGFNNEVINCSVGPGDPLGMHIEEVKDVVFRSNRVNGCTIGIRVVGGDVEIEDQDVTGCAQGVLVTDQATCLFIDLDLTDTTIDVGMNTDTNISTSLSTSWDTVIANLTCDLSVPATTTVNVNSSVLNFESTSSGPKGIWVLRGGTLNLFDSTIDNPKDHSLVLQLEDGCRVKMRNLDIRHVGTSSAGARRMGMFVAGSGTIEECTISDSIAGIVVGKSVTEFINLTIRDCLVGVMADGDLGRGGISIRGLDISGCDVVVKAVNDGSVTIANGHIQLVGEGFNITTASVLIKDSWVSDPGAGSNTATLRQTSTLDIVNSHTSRVFDVGSTENFVNIYWYVNLTLRYLSDGSPLSEATATITEATGTVSDRDVLAGVDGTISELQVRERAYLPGLLISTPHTFTVSKSYLSDSFQLTVEESMDHVFYMDNYPPVLTVEQPVDGSFHSTSTITFSGEAYDAVVTETAGLDYMQYRVDGGEWLPIDLPEGTTWTFEAAIESGFHTVEVHVRDLIGNTNSTVVTVEVDVEPPNLVVLAPEDGIYTIETEMLVSGVSDPDANVTVNDEEVELDAEGRFNVTLTLVEGANLIRVVASDAQGNEAVETRNVTLDTVQPEVVFDPGTLRTNQTTFTLTGTKKVNSTLYVNGPLPQFYHTTTFEIQVDLPEERMNPVDVWSEDMAGNNWSTTLFIERDTTPPVLSVGQLPEFTNKASVTVQGSVDDSDAVVTINGVEVTLSGLAFAQVVALADGENTVTVEASDDLGNAAEPVVQVITLSTTPPNLVILSDKTIETLEQKYELEGETDPGLPVNVRVELGPYSKTYNVLAGDDGSFSVEVDLPQIGNHSVIVTVTNEAGNQANEQLTFVRKRQVQPPPTPPPDDSWLSENWEYVILLAAILGAGTIWLLTLSKARRRREELAARRAARARELENQEGWDEADEGAPDEDIPEVEDSDEGVPEEEDSDEEIPEEKDSDEDVPEDASPSGEEGPAYSMGAEVPEESEDKE